MKPPPPARLARLLDPAPRPPRRCHLDLFGEIPVTAADVALWIRTVAGLDPDSPRAAWYASAYRVADKVAQAKAAGFWPPE